MKTSHTIKYWIAIVLTVATARAGAASVVFENGLLIGVNGVNAMDTTWNVSFQGGTYESVFATLDPRYLDDEISAETATTALLTDLNALVPNQPYDQILGCATNADTWCYVFTPSSQVGSVVNGFAALDKFGKWQPPGGIVGFEGTDDLDHVTYTLWVEAVPVPAAVWLFGSGLLGLIGMARRKKA